MATKRNLWGTRFGFYLAAIGSAFGLGNLWRFPFVAVDNGGGVFVMLYIMLVLMVGLPLLISELMLGKLTRSSSVAALKSLGGKYVWIGWLSLISCLLILSYYSAVSGWVLHFLARFTFGNLGLVNFDSEESLQILREDSGLQLLLTSAHLAIALIVVLKGVQQGIERWIGNLMPLFCILLVLLVGKSMSLPSSATALRFFFYPDFSNLHWGTLLKALGHVLFTLSLGFGIMMTFGSYLQDRTYIPSAGFRVVALDTVISLFAGLLIMPLAVDSVVYQASPEMLFSTLPKLLSDIDYGAFFGIAFFLSLYIAALGATIGMLESMVASLMGASDSLTRGKAASYVGAATLVFSVLPILMHSTFRNVRVLGRPPLFWLDYIFVNILLPLVALGICLAIGRKFSRAKLKEEFVNDDSAETQVMFSHWLFSIKYIVPGIIFTAFSLAIVGWLVSFR